MKKHILTFTFLATALAAQGQNVRSFTETEPIGLLVTRLEGRGNMGRTLDFEPSVYDSLFTWQTNRVYHPVYRSDYGPIWVEALDTALVPDGPLILQLIDSVTPGNLTDAGWKMYEVGTSDTVYSQSALGLWDGIEQLIPQWGLLVQLHQVTDPGDQQLPCEQQVLDCTIEYQGSSWLNFLADVDQPSNSYQNWIRSGTSDEDYGDSQECFESLIQGTWAPWKLASHEADQMSPTWSQFKTLNDLRNLASVDIVITADTSRWSRCAIVEVTDGNLPSIGNAKRFNLRMSPSVNKLGQSDASGTYGLGWFPGYAVNVETGQRLNMAFGESSWLMQDNGADMIWNPTSSQVSFSGEPVIGGGHYIYIFGNNGTDPNNDVPAYDEGQFIFDKLSDNNYNPSNAEKRRVWKDCMWVSMPMLQEGASLLTNDVAVKLRVSKPYRNYATIPNPENQFNVPRYRIEKVRFQNPGLNVSENSGLRMMVHPNPASDMITLSVAENMHLTDVLVVSVLGEVVFQSSPKSNLGPRLEIPLAHVPSGIYFVAVRSDQGSSVRKLILSK